jgi:hypothetical protein
VGDRHRTVAAPQSQTVFVAFVLEEVVQVERVGQLVAQQGQEHSAPADEHDGVVEGEEAVDAA